MDNIFIIMKICVKCDNEKSLEEFYKTTRNKTGYENKCKICRNNDSSNFIKSNSYKQREYSKKYYFNNKNKKREYEKIYRKKYNKLEKHINYNKQYNTNRKKLDPGFKISILIRSRILHALKTQRTNKNNKTIYLIGCTFPKLKTHLESQFKPEMTWENHGKIWEIDHIKPCSKFDLTDIEQQKQCFHHTNLQPLFKTTRIAKSFGYEEIGNRNKFNNIY